MEKNRVVRFFENKETEAEEMADKICENPDLIQEVFGGIYSKKPRSRFGSAKVLRIISEKKPEMIYSRIQFFENLLDSKNNILKWIALDTIANLTTIDAQKEFNRLFETYYSKLFEGSLITAGHVIDNSGKIARSKPELLEKITIELLKVEEIPLPTEECRNILVGKTINAIQTYYEKIKDKSEVLSFIKRHVNNSRKATRVRAEKFLKI